MNNISKSNKSNLKMYFLYRWYQIHDDTTEYKTPCTSCQHCIETWKMTKYFLIKLIILTLQCRLLVMSSFSLDSGFWEDHKYYQLKIYLNIELFFHTAYLYEDQIWIPDKVILMIKIIILINHELRQILMNLHQIFIIKYMIKCFAWNIIFF